MTKDYRGVWVFAEQRKRKLQDVGLELLGQGAKLAHKLDTELGAIVIGYRVRALAQELTDWGADKVYLADSPALEVYRSEPYMRVLERAVVEHKPEILLFGATAIGTDLAPRLAARLGTGLTADCIELDIDEEGRLVQTVPAFGGSLMAKVICPNHRPQMATVRPGVMEKPQRETRPAVVEDLATKDAEQGVAVRVVETVVMPQEAGVALEKAEVVIGGGAGVGSPQNWELVVRLAHALGGAVGATRPAADEGWASEEQMVGQSGKVIRPQLYIAIGISGAIQHMVGVQESKIIVAINNDPTAPIFKEADIGLVADFREIVPGLIEEIEKRVKRAA